MKKKLLPLLLPALLLTSCGAERKEPVEWVVQKIDEKVDYPFYYTYEKITDYDNVFKQGTGLESEQYIFTVYVCKSDDYHYTKKYLGYIYYDQNGFENFFGASTLTEDEIIKIGVEVIG